MAVIRIRAPARVHLGTVGFGASGDISTPTGKNLQASAVAGATAVATLLKGIRLLAGAVGGAQASAALSIGNTAPVWQGQWVDGATPVPTVNFVKGVASYFDLDPHCLNEEGFNDIGATLPAGVTLNSSLKRLVHAASGSSAGLTENHRLEAVNSAGSGISLAANAAVAGSAAATLTNQAGTKQLVAAAVVSGVATANLSGGESTPVTEFKLLSATGMSDAPFAIGHAFKQGDVPSGQYIVTDTAGVAGMSAVVKNTWADGSVKFAILAGRATLSSGVEKTIAVKRTASAPSGSNVALAALQALITTHGLYTVNLGAHGVCDLFSAIALGVTTYTAGNVGNKKWSAGRIRQWVASPEMSEWHFYTPAPSDDHLAVFWHVRLWADNQLEVEVIVDNGWLKVATPTAKTYTPVVTINSTARGTFSELTHLHHTRWSRAYWANASTPEIVPKHDPVYLRASKMVPNYGWNNPASAAWVLNAAPNGWETPLNTTSPEPFIKGNASSAMGDYGYDETIGLLPRWEALYCTSGDARAYRATIGNARCYGRYPMIYRDETTLRPIRFSSYPNLVLYDNQNGYKYGVGGSSTLDYTPNPSGGYVQFTDSHFHAPGYLAYLITGKHQFLEQMQFVAMANYMSRRDYHPEYPHRNRGDGIHYIGQRRSTAWQLRTVGSCAAMTPSTGDAADTVLRTEFLNCYSANVSFFHDNWASVAGANYNTLGLIWNDAGFVINGGMGCSVWETDFMFQAFGFVRDIEPELAAPIVTKRNALMTWMGPAVINRLGTTDFDYALASRYTFRIAETTSAATLYSTWAQVFTGTYGTNNYSAGAPLINSSNGTPEVAASFPSGYWANMMPAIAYAVDVGISGGVDGRARMMLASNWISATTGSLSFNDNPIWGIVPRG